MFYKNGIKEGIEILNPKCKFFPEDRLWIKLCANYFSFEKDLYLCLVYISPETSTHQSSRNNNYMEPIGRGDFQLFH